MGFMNSIIDLLNETSSRFYNVYLEMYGWLYPFYLPAIYFYYLSTAFSNLAWQFSYFSSWVSSATSSLAGILTYANIYSYFYSYFQYAIDAWSWVVDAWYNVTAIIDTWWTATSLTVQAWIQVVSDELDYRVTEVWETLGALYDEWIAFRDSRPSIDELISWFGDWWNSILAPLTAWWNERLLDIAGLIDSAFLLRSSWWDSWQELRDQVVEFFADPVEWLWTRFTDWFLGPEV